LTETLRWSKPETHGQPPAARDGHTACVIGHRMYIFGGYEEVVSRLKKTRYISLTKMEGCTVVVPQIHIFQSIKWDHSMVE